MTSDDLTVGGLRALLDTIERGNATDHLNIRNNLNAVETRLSKQISDGFTEIRGTIDTGLKGEIDVLESGLDRLQARLARLENWRYYIAGGLVVISLLVTTLGMLLVPRMLDAQTAITRHLILEEQTEPWHENTTTTTVP
jgi:hypothetical protein